MPLLGAIVNAVVVVAGSLLGLLFRAFGKNKSTQNDRYRSILMNGMALCVAYIGIKGFFDGNNALIIIISIAVGALIGELCQFDKWITKIGEYIEKKFPPKDEKTSVTQGFVSASLLFCVGAMSIVGALNSGIQGDHTTQFTKALIDGITAVVLTVSMGYGVIFSSLAVLVFQGSITLLAGVIAPYLSEAIIAEMSCVGSLLIFALSLNMLGLTKIKVVNYVPAIFLPILLCQFM